MFFEQFLQKVSRDFFCGYRLLKDPGFLGVQSTGQAQVATNALLVHVIGFDWVFHHALRVPRPQVAACRSFIRICDFCGLHRMPAG